MAERMKYIRWFSELGVADVPLVGGKNASLGEMYRELASEGVRVPNGFAITAEAYRHVLDQADAWQGLHRALDGLDARDVDDLARRAQRAREIIHGAALPDDLLAEIRAAHARLGAEYGDELTVAVRSSATAEDLPTASFAGQHETFLNVAGEARLIDSVRLCFASLFKDRAISRARAGHSGGGRLRPGDVGHPHRRGGHRVVRGGQRGPRLCGRDRLHQDEHRPVGARAPADAPDGQPGQPGHGVPDLAAAQRRHGPGAHGVHRRRAHQGASDGAGASAEDRRCGGARGDRAPDARLRAAGRLLSAPAGGRRGHHRRGLLPEAGDRAHVRLQDQRVREPAGRALVRAGGGQSETPDTLLQVTRDVLAVERRLGRPPREESP